MKLIFLAVLVCGACGCTRSQPAAPEIQTHLYALEKTVVYLDKHDGSGGALESMGDDVLVVTPQGRIALIPPNGDVEYLDGQVPMNLSGWESTESFVGKENRYFRVADTLLKELSPGRFELFVTHHYFTGECVRFRLSSTTLEHKSPPPPPISGANNKKKTVTVLPSWRTIFEANHCFKSSLYGEQSGGKMLSDGPHHLLVLIGDHARDGWRPPAVRAPVASDPDSHLGKLVRVTIETGDAQILAVGLRNPQGLARDKDGNLWAAEHGPQGGDELNLLEPGGHYGWPHVTYGVDYGRTVPAPIEYEMVGRHDGFAEPVFSWAPSIAPTSITVNDERWFPLWRDDLLIASLRARSIFRVRRLGKKVQYVERIEMGAPIRDMTWMPDGRLALLYAYGATHVVFLSRSQKYCDEESRERRDVYAAHCGPESPDKGNPGAEHVGERPYGRHCGSCHGLDLEQHGGDGPSLSGVIGRRAGSAAGYDFSDAYGSLDHVWTRDSLVRFLVDPELFPDASMSELSVTEAEARAIVDFIGAFSAP